MGKLSVLAGINNLSYGVVGLNLTLELHKQLGHGNLSLWPINPNPSVNTSQEDATIVEHCINNARSLSYDPDAPSVRIWHQNDLSLHPSRTTRVGWPIFELNKFNEIELLHLKSLDSLVVCSKWAKEVIKNNNINVKTDVVPLGVNRDIFRPLDDMPEWQSTRFLCVGKTEVRKSHDILHEIFSDAFNEKDNVELWISWENPFLTPSEKDEWQTLYKNSKLGDKIKFVPYQQSPHQLNTVYNNVDCLISLSRAEGWNLPLLEGLSCGKHVIATNYSGHTEFLNEDNASLISVDEFEAAYDGKWFHGQGDWAVLAEGQKEEAIEYMRNVHKMKQEGQNLFNDEGIKTAQQFSWENAASKLLETIQ